MGGERVACRQEGVLLPDRAARLPSDAPSSSTGGDNFFALRLQRRLPQLLPVFAQAVVRWQVGLVLSACWPRLPNHSGSSIMRSCSEDTRRMRMVAPIATSSSAHLPFYHETDSRG